MVKLYQYQLVLEPGSVNLALETARDRLAKEGVEDGSHGL
jgi:hypothetical protein